MWQTALDDARQGMTSLKVQLEDCRKNREGDEARLSADERQRLRDVRTDAMRFAQGNTPQGTTVSDIISEADKYYKFITKGEAE